MFQGWFVARSVRLALTSNLLAGRSSTNFFQIDAVLTKIKLEPVSDSNCRRLEFSLIFATDSTGRLVSVGRRRWGGRGLLPASPDTALVAGIRLSLVLALDRFHPQPSSQTVDPANRQLRRCTRHSPGVADC